MAFSVAFGIRSGAIGFDGMARRAHGRGGFVMALAAVRSRRSAPRFTTEDPVAREVGLQKLLSSRICDLTLKVEDTLFDCLAQVTSELRQRQISFIPAYYLGDDDFWTADRATSVNVPWYLANALLWQLVNDHLFEYSREEVLMYLRHETGHAINYAFELWKRKDWTQTFGEFRRPYRDVYTPNPWSHDYVRYLHRAGMYHYAQKHPDEDFAETFAVWLDPSSRWRRRYKDWQVALAKLEYVERIIEVEGACRGTAPNERLGQRIGYESIKETVADYFDIAHAVDPDLAEYRRDLLEIFPRRPPRSRGSALSAARFIQQHQQMLVEKIDGWIGKSDRRVIEKFLRQLQALCTYEHLVVPDSQRNEKLVDMTIVATWHVLDGIHRLSGD
jgi:hypothetical protein